HYTDTARGLVDKTDKEQIDSIYNDIYLNYETKLGHYFRVLYHIVLFVDSSDIENKKDYTNLLRAQLSSRETLLLCFNCISRFGYDKFLPLVEQYSLLKHINDNKELLRYKFDNIIEDKAFNLDE
ncbi:MAG: hypothetical protein PF444_03450, partial [Bacteroidales bacterium]|nr:hypothetical protein [Bacteroidales bacterium]